MKNCAYCTIERAYSPYNAGLGKIPLNLRIIIIMKTLFKGLCCLLLISGVASADLAINFSSTTGRGGKETTAATVADFAAITGTQLDAATAVLFNADPDILGGGVGGGWNFFNTTQTNVAGSGLDVTTTGNGNGFNAQSNSWTDGDVILDGYIFGVANQTITIDGLNALALSGETIIVSAFGIGDNFNQDSDFSVTYAGSTTATQATLFNGGSNRAVEDGSVPVVHFALAADGVTNSLTINVLGGGQVNAFSIAVVPEPSSAILLASLSLVGVGFRRRRRNS